MNQNLEDTPDLDKAIRALVKITNRSPEEIKLHLEKFLAQFSQNPSNLKNHFFETATDDEWVSAFFSWSQSHKSQKLPVLSEEAISRESIYPDRW